MKIKAHEIWSVIFDLDDTLYREYDYVYEAFMHVAEYLGSKYDAQEKELFFEMQEEMQNHGRGAVFNAVCDKHHWAEPVTNLVRIYRETKPKLKLYPDAENFLEYLKQNNIKTGIITDGDAGVQGSKVEGLGLQKKVNEIMLTDTYGREYWKPNPQVYKDILAKLGCKAENAVYIGDNPNKDFIGAKQIGMQTIRIVRKQGDHMKDVADVTHEANMKIELLTDLIQGVL